MKKVITIGGSTSKKSINKKLAEYSGELMQNVELIKLDLNDYPMPIYSIDLENEQGFSKETLELNKLISEADGFVVSLAEHNGAYAAAFKNVYDWLSRIESKVWRDKPMLLLSTSPGGRGGQTVLEIARATFPRMGSDLIGSMPFPSFNNNFKENEIVNKELKTDLLDLVSRFEKAL